MPVYSFYFEYFIQFVFPFFSESECVHAERLSVCHSMSNEAASVFIVNIITVFELVLVSAS